MAVAAASLVVMSTLHLAGALGQVSQPYDPSGAGIAEATIGAVLAYGAVVLFRFGATARRTAIAATGFAVAGFLVGLRFTVPSGEPIDIVYHAAMLPLLLAALALLLRHKSGPARGR